MNRKHWSELSLREQIGQTVVAQSGSATLGRNMDDLEHYPVGAYFVGTEVIKELDSSNVRTELVRETARQFQDKSAVPLLICSDMENGCGNMIKGLTPLPYLMALGSTGSAELAYEYGKATALEARSIGVNWTFSPVADLNTNKYNPITNTRALSDEPGLAKRLLGAMIQGMQDHGLAAAAKHFPGDGTDDRDQHLVTTRNRLTLAEWRQQHGAVFQELIDRGVHSIMTGHISFPAYQTAPANGIYRPATLCPELSIKLLKQEMGFGGVIVSDALTMGGYVKGLGRNVSPAVLEVESFNAGTDMLLWPTLDYFPALEAALKSGAVPMSRLEDALERIWRMKETLGLFMPGGSAPTLLTASDTAYVGDVARRTAEGGLTLVWNRQAMLPLRREAIRRVRIVVITNHDPILKDFTALKEAFERRGMEVRMEHYLCDDENGETLQLVADTNDLLLYALYTRAHMPCGPLNFFEEQAGMLWGALTAGMAKSVVVSFGSPYLGHEYFETAPAYLNAYFPDPATQEAVVQALLGEIPFCGVSPVRL